MPRAERLSNPINNYAKGPYAQMAVCKDTFMFLYNIQYTLDLQCTGSTTILSILSLFPFETCILYVSLDVEQATIGVSINQVTNKQIYQFPK